MLPKEHRLTKKEDFAKVYREGNFFSIGAISLKLARNNLKVSRFGFPLEKKIFKKATQRNRIRRLLREVLQSKLPAIKSGFDIVIFYKNNRPADSLDVIAPLIEKIIRKSNLLIEK